MSDSVEVTIGGEPKVITMSFGLLNVCTRVVGDLDSLPELTLNSDVREAILIQVLSERDKNGKIKEEISVFNLDMKPDEVIELLDWVGSHVADFFLNSMKKVKNLMTDREKILQELMPSSDGGVT